MARTILRIRREALYSNVSKIFRQTPKIPKRKPNLQLQLQERKPAKSYLSEKQYEPQNRQQHQMLISNSILYNKPQKSIKSATVLIRGIWGHKGTIQAMSHTTGFAISPSILISCAHGIYDTTTHQPCNSAKIINVDGVSEIKHVKQSKKYNFLRYQRVKQGSSYGFKPLRQDFSVMVLDEPLQLSEYLYLSEEEPEEGEKLQLWGYPSQNYMVDTPDIGTRFERSDLEGKYLGKKGDREGNYILIHNMLSQVGHSGSPIVRMNRNKQRPEVVSIHTHKGMEARTGQGLLISAIRSNIISYAIQLLKDHYLKDQLNQFLQLYNL